MSTNHTVKFATNPEDFGAYGADQIGEGLPMPDLFSYGDINLVYTHDDRFTMGVAKPKNPPLTLEAIHPLKADPFLNRRKIGITNVGEKRAVLVVDEEYTLDFKDVLYAGKEAGEKQPLFYLISAPAHKSDPTRKKITRDDAEIVEFGSLQTSSHRIIRQLLVHSIVKICQLQMGMTRLEEGSVWNTGSPHFHDRRTETHFYFEPPEGQVVCHFLGEPDNTRHIRLINQQAALPSPWSIHSGSGISNYTFIWGIAGKIWITAIWIKQSQLYCDEIFITQICKL